jgi:predicted O-methyltransferase YrrM
MQLIKHDDSWIPLEHLGTHIPPYRPTYDAGAVFINAHHEAYAECPLRDGVLIDIGVPGWLRREDALKLYELAYYADGNILELGSAQGLSTSILVQAIRDSGLNKSLTIVDIKRISLLVTRRNLLKSGNCDFVHSRLGDAAAVCRDLARETSKFALVFIDHSHAFQRVLEVAQILTAVTSDGGFCLFHDFNDARNLNPANLEYKVPQAVHNGLDMSKFEFYGIYGCAALFRKTIPG